MVRDALTQQRIELHLLGSSILKIGSAPSQNFHGRSGNREQLGRPLFLDHLWQPVSVASAFPPCCPLVGFPGQSSSGLTASLRCQPKEAGPLPTQSQSSKHRPKSKRALRVEPRQSGYRVWR